MFKALKNQMVNFHRDQGGQGMAEYGLILALVAVAAVLGFTFLGNRVNSKMQEVGNAMN
jgi:pilus assembly protein Flp/PilA